MCAGALPGCGTHDCVFTGEHTCLRAVWMPCSGGHSAPEPGWAGSGPPRGGLVLVSQPRSSATESSAFSVPWRLSKAVMYANAPVQKLSGVTESGTDRRPTRSLCSESTWTLDCRGAGGACAPHRQKSAGHPGLPENISSRWVTASLPQREAFLLTAVFLTHGTAVRTQPRGWQLRGVWTGALTARLRAGKSSHLVEREPSEVK